MSSFLVMSDWILPYALMSMEYYFKQTRFIQPHDRINKNLFVNVLNIEKNKQVSPEVKGTML